MDSGIEIVARKNLGDVADLEVSQQGRNTWMVRIRPKDSRALYVPMGDLIDWLRELKAAAQAQTRVAQEAQANGS